MISDQWRRVNRQHPCPVCHHHDWCLVAADGSTAICPRVESSKRAGQAGYLHRLTDSPTHQSHATPAPIVKRGTDYDYGNFATECQAAAENAGAIDHASRRLGITPGSLRRFRIGWWIAQSCWTWPMTDAGGSRIIGITRRFLDGSKKCLKGARAGLYVPADLPRDMSKLTLLVVEGGSDAAAGLDLGFWSIGRFSCTHGAPLLRRVLRQRRPAQVAICADTGNIHEKRGAEKLARDLLPYARELRLIAPPAKDLRAWLRSGATHTDVHRLIEAAPVRRLRVSAR